MKFDLQDGLMVLGAIAFFGGIAAYSFAAAAIVFGVACFMAVYLIAVDSRATANDGKKGST